MLIQQVLDPLRRLNQLHTELLGLGERKRAILVVNNIDELTKIVSLENKLVKQIAESENVWLESAKQFLESKGVKPEASVTMSDLIKLVFNPSDKQMLQNEQQRLLSTIEELKKLNAFNQQLIEQSLTYINYTLDLVTGAPEGDTVYLNPNKQSSQGSRRGVFDTKA